MEIYCRVGQSQIAILRMRIACWIPKATNTHSQYVILIALPLQKYFAPTRLNVTLHAHCVSCSCIALIFQNTKIHSGVQIGDLLNDK